MERPLFGTTIRRMRRDLGLRPPHRWTVDEIHALPEFGADHGWFYGLVRDEGIHLAEILPGTGWAHPFWRDVLRHPWLVVRDLRHHRPPPAPLATAHASNTHVSVPFNSTASTAQLGPAPNGEEE